MQGSAHYAIYPYVKLFLLLLPALLGAVVTVARVQQIVEWTDRFGQWAANKRASYSVRTGFIHKYVLRPFFSGFVKIDGWTSSIENMFLKAGVRAGSYLYFAGVFAYLVAITTLIIIVIAIAIVVVLVSIWIAEKMMNKEDEGGYAREKTDWSGRKLTQHYAAQGDKLGQTETKEGVFGGEYRQHYNAGGDKSGYSVNEEGVFGDKYTQHSDESGEKIGYSTEQERISGEKYTQHYDQDGRKTGYSEKEESIFGEEYTQHYYQRGKKAGDSKDK